MSRPQPLVDKTPAVRLIKGQLMVAITITLIASFWGSWSSLSAGVGASIAVIGSAYFALQAFRHAGAGSAKQIVRSFYKGAAGRFVLTVLLFSAAFAGIKALQAGWVLAGFFIVQLVAWVSPLWDALRHKP
ncbi:ATP synthase subunit I [Agitococcus lubricus]|uniref:ATP synthase protein I n=1 Tax=Agitococcus lubricus TaxID=1077255 RepID=A0A2T5J369_9GAMM|nr:ATP synthase subunit I [Agitococcus lubricus]PTQ91069.1 ATP synthase protein I [Agitococcus lubricus]